MTAKCTQNLTKAYSICFKSRGLSPKALFLCHLCSLLRAPIKKSSTYKPSLRHILFGNTKVSTSEYAIQACWDFKRMVSSSVFKVTRIIVIVDGCLFPYLYTSKFYVSLSSQLFCIHSYHQYFQEIQKAFIPKLSAGNKVKKIVLGIRL